MFKPLKLGKKRTENDQFRPPYKKKESLKMVFTKNPEGEYSNSAFQISNRSCVDSIESVNKESSNSEDQDHINRVKGPRSIWDKYMRRKIRNDKETMFSDELETESLNNCDTGSFFVANLKSYDFF